jgi:hypothetical protein
MRSDSRSRSLHSENVDRRQPDLDVRTAAAEDPERDLRLSVQEERGVGAAVGRAAGVGAVVAPGAARRETMRRATAFTFST